MEEIGTLDRSENRGTRKDSSMLKVLRLREQDLPLHDAPHGNVQGHAQGGVQGQLLVHRGVVKVGPHSHLQVHDEDDSVSAL